MIVCGVFIHWEANDDKKIYQYNYDATKLAIARAMKNEPSAERNAFQEGNGEAPVLRSLKRDERLGAERSGLASIASLIRLRIFSHRLPLTPAYASHPGAFRHGSVAQRV